MIATHQSRCRISILLAVLLIFQLIALPRAEAANQAVRTVSGGVLGFLAGAVAMTALGVGGLAVVAGCVAGVYVGKWIGKNWNSFFKARKKEIAEAGKAVVNTAVSATQRLKDQEAKAAEFINSLTGQKDSNAQAVSSIQIEEAMAKYQAAYKSYSEAVQRGDGEAAKKYGEQYRTYQAQYQALLKGR